MDAMRFFGFVAVVLAGGVMTAFILGCLNTERRSERATRTRRVEVEPAIQSIATLPAFFAKLNANDHASAASKLDDALIAFLENHIKAEQAMARKFVHLPSIDSLYRQSQAPPTMN